MPYGGQEECGACCHQTEEEDYDYGVLVVHEIMAEPRAARRDTAICELDIEAAKERRYVEHEEAVEKADGRVPVVVSIRW
mgnify:CR=1 FL=1